MAFRKFDEYKNRLVKDSFARAERFEVTVLSKKLIAKYLFKGPSASRIILESVISKCKSMSKLISSEFKIISNSLFWAIELNTTTNTKSK